MTQSHSIACAKFHHVQDHVILQTRFSHLNFLWVGRLTTKYTITRGEAGMHLRLLHLQYFSTDIGYVILVHVLPWCLCPNEHKTDGEQGWLDFQLCTICTTIIIWIQCVCSSIGSQSFSITLLCNQELHELPMPIARRPTKWGTGKDRMTITNLIRIL